MSAESLRKGGPIGQGAGASGKEAKSTAGLSNTTARETPAHNSAQNVQTKHATSHKGFGELGGKGHGGSL